MILLLGSLLVFSLGIAIGIYIGSPDHSDKISYSSEEIDRRIVNKELKEVIIAEAQKSVDLPKSLPNLDQFKNEKVVDLSKMRELAEPVGRRTLYRLKIQKISHWFLSF